MGGCQCRCQITTQGTGPKFEIVYTKKNSQKRSKKDSRSGSSSSQREKVTNATQFTKQQQNNQNFTDSIGDENHASDENLMPKFLISKKVIMTLPPRMNRFYEDMEFEVKMKIKENRQEEEKLRQEYLIEQIRRQEENFRKQYEQSLAEENEQLNNKQQKIEENDLKQFVDGIQLEQQQLQLELVEININNEDQEVKSEVSSFNYNESVHSQFEQQNDLPEVQILQQQPQNIQKKLNQRDGEQMSNFASNGSGSELQSQKQNQQQGIEARVPFDPLEKMFSEFYIADKNMFQQSSSRSGGFKSILKYKSYSGGRYSRSGSNKTNKSSKTSKLFGKKQQNKKHVRFSQDTNFNFERKYPKQLIIEKSWFSFW